MRLNDQVAALMRRVADEVIVPRFRQLTALEIAEKRPGEIVTSVDRTAERRLHEALAALGLDARIIGEEAADADPALLAGVGEGQVWLIDPLDGTANYAEGRAPFGVMVALVEDGEPVIGWMLDPLSGRLCHAERNKGARVDGRLVQARMSGMFPPRAQLATQFMRRAQHERIHALAGEDLEVVPIPRCAAESYPRLVLGVDDVALFQRILPWDHAAGVLFLNEAGGRATHWDRSPYRVGKSSQGILAASAPHLWAFAADVLLEGAQSFDEARAA